MYANVYSMNGYKRAHFEINSHLVLLTLEQAEERTKDDSKTGINGMGHLVEGLSVPLWAVLAS